MRLLPLLLTVAMLGPIVPLFGQSTVDIRNNTRNNLHLSVTQLGNTTLPANSWQLEQSFMEWWAEDQTVLSIDRSAANLVTGDTAYFDIAVASLTDTMHIMLLVAGTSTGTTLAYGVEGQGNPLLWHTDSAFHQVSAVMGGRDVVIKFKPNNSDDSQSRSILFAIHDAPIYEIDPADFQNPYVLNVMSFNAQMLPLGIAGLKEAELRADLIPLEMHASQDVVFFQELMDPTARLDHLIPGMTAAGFPYHTTVLNDTSAFITNGGVIYFSRWPIVRTKDMKYSVCGPSSEDCLAIKGVQYVQINKLGINYHLFGTHMDAGSQQPDLDARQTQMGEIRRFIEAQNIPQYEAVLFGGDLNISPFTVQNQYEQILDSLNPVLPNFTGFYASTDGTIYPGKIIDHIWPLKSNLVPIEATNYVVTFRSIDDRMWEMSWLGDHRPVLGRFVFPELRVTRPASAICPGDTLLLGVATTLPTTLNWSKNGSSLSNGADTVAYYPATAADGGQYNCEFEYSATFGGIQDTLNRYFHLNGEETVNVQMNVAFGNITVDSVLCLLGSADIKRMAVTLYPNPASNVLQLELPSQALGATLTIMDAQGQLKQQTTINETLLSLDVSNLANGLYLIQIITPTQLATARLLIQK